MTYEEQVAITKAGFSYAIKGALTSALSAWIPPLAVPPLSLLVKFITGKIAKVIVDNAEIGVFFAYTNFRVDTQGRDFMDAAIKNHEAQIKGTPEEKIRAEEKLKDSFRKLVSLTN